MKKILIANKFYYPRGGDCIYTISLAKLLKEHSHDTAIFAMQHPETISTKWNKYFPSEVNFGSNLSLEAFMRPFGSAEVIRNFDALLNDFKPDVVHLNNIHSQLSPVIAQLASRKGIRVIWTLHDSKLLCPRYDCLRNGVSCELCMCNKFNVIKYKCLKKSFAASCLAYWESKKWNKEKLQECTDTFITPSIFLYNRMIAGGFVPSKVTQLYHFVDKNKYEGVAYGEKENYYCYIGRLASDKGVMTLLDVANRLPYPLKIIGDGPLKDVLTANANKNIEFLGFKDWSEIKHLINKARFIVVPSEVQEILGLVVIEAQCVGTPALGARVGGIPELIEENVNGMTFASRNVEELRDKIEQMWNHTFDYNAVADNAQNKYNAEMYYRRLINIYDKSFNQ